MNKDTVIGIAGAVMLIAAMVGVFAYERANAEVPDEGGEPTPEASIGQETLTGNVDLGSSVTRTNNITAVGPSHLTFVMTWSASEGSDTLRLTVTPPADSGLAQRASQEEEDGSITVRFAIAAEHVSHGDWTLKVDFTRATPDDVAGIPPPAGGTTDSTVSFGIGTMFE